jgi:cell division protein FtsN
MVIRIFGKSSLLVFAGFVTMSVILLFQGACLIGKKTASTPSPLSGPIRIVFLPLNIPSGSTDLRTFALSVPVLMAQAATNAPGLEVVPLWESMPVVLKVAGPSRIITPEMASTIANFLSATWATQGELVSAGSRVLVTEDFIPADQRHIAFRYQRKCGLASLDQNMREATVQFLRYIAAKPLTRSKGMAMTSKHLEEIAGALDREYGWFVNAEPGHASETFAGMSRSENRLAGALFNPKLYSASSPNQEAVQPQPKPSGMERPDLGSAKALSSGSGLNQGTVAKTSPAVTSAFSGPPTKEEVGSPSPAESAPPATTESNPKPSQTRPSAESIPPSPPASAAGASSSVSARKGDRSMASESVVAASSDLNKVEGHPLKRIASSETADTATPESQPGFAIQVFSSHSKSNAEGVVRRLRKAGLVARIEESESWYRVRVHGYKSHRAAKAAAERLLDQGVIGQYWIVR